MINFPEIEGYFLKILFGKENEQLDPSRITLPDMRRFMEQTSVIHEISSLGNIETLKILLDNYGVDFINKVDDDFYTAPICIAASKGFLDTVKLLLEYGADVNAYDESHIGNTALREVAETASYEMIKLLIDNGADPDIEGWMRLTALDKAQERFEKNNSDENRRILELIKKHSRKK